MKVRALKPITYGGKRYLKGDVFDASPFYVKPLVALGKLVAEPEEAEEQVDEITGTKPARRSRKADPDKPRRQYRRRDMQAEA